MFDPSSESATALLEDSQGKLGLLTLPSLIHDVCDEQHTGILTVRDDDHEKTVFIESGRIVFAQSNDLDDRLGTLFLKKGMVGLSDIESAATEAMATGQRMGGVLVQMQAIRPQDLVSGVREQVMEIVTGLFTWTKGSYETNFGPLPGKEVITLKMSTGDMVLEGVRRINSWSRIKLAVGDLETMYQVSPRLQELGQQMNLSLDEWTFLSRCEGPISLQQLCEASALKDFEVCRLVWAFSVVGLLNRLS
jgi:hypothetical protein